LSHTVFASEFKTRKQHLPCAASPPQRCLGLSGTSPWRSPSSYP